MRASVAGLLVVLCFLAGFAIISQRSVEATSRRADRALQVSASYQDARDWVERGEVRAAPLPLRGQLQRPASRTTRRQRRLVAALEDVRRRDPSPADAQAHRLTCSPCTRSTTTPAGAVRGRRRRRRGGDPALRPRGHRPGLRRPGGRGLPPGPRRAGERARRQRHVRAKGVRAKRAIRVAFGVGLALLAWFAADHPALPAPARRGARGRARAPRRRSPSPTRSPGCATTARSTRTSRASCSASAAPGRRSRSCSLDLDDLKTVNDEHGHQAGDERLQALAEAIRATQRAGDCAYRVGGDEFAISARRPPAPTARWSSPSACAPPRGPASTASPSRSPPASPRRSSCARRTSWSARPTSR